ncbi:MAG: hypothetical protein Q3962_08880 [Corynebacterium sp.]|nr:hypothetical protein [Corynebacterium sp.]
MNKPGLEGERRKAKNVENRDNQLENSAVKPENRDITSAKRG